MTVFSAMSVIITSAAAVIYPNAKLADLWDPTKLIGHFDEPWLVAMAMLTVVVATLSVNIAANVVSPANDFANAFPRFITFRTGGLITGIIGLIMQPWRLLADPKLYIFQWLQGYSGGLAAIAGVMITDYWIIRKRHLDLPDLYLEQGAYTYNRGWNWRAVVATVLGCAAVWIGLVVPALSMLYDAAWLVGIVTSAGVYYALMRMMPPSAEQRS
jgi:NCS1 family nucleobase:cation symporter-1